MNPTELLDVAATLLADVVPASDARIRRAASTIYYAMFHALANTAATLLVGSDPDHPAWQLLYRSIDHGAAKRRCISLQAFGPVAPGIEEFAELFVALQSKRHKADYDPGVLVRSDDVSVDLSYARRAIAQFDAAPVEERRAFCAYVMTRDRRS